MVLFWLIVIAGWWRVFGPAATLAAVILFAFLPPGVLGENSAEIALLAIGILLALATLSPVNAPKAGTRGARQTASALHLPIVLSLLVAGCGLGWLTYALIPSGVPVQVGVAVGLMFLLGSGLLLVLANRAGLAESMLRAFGWLLVPALILFLVAWSLGFERTSVIRLPYRRLVFFEPGALANGSGGFLQPLPRFTGMVGEPGLLVLMILAGLWVAVSLEKGIRRWVLLICSLVGAVLSQSTASAIAVAAFLSALLLSVTLRKKGVLAATAVAVPLLAGLAWSTANLLQLKAVTNVTSSQDRGFSGGQFDFNNLAGTITMLGALRAYPLIALPLVMLTILVATRLRRDGPTAALSIGLLVVSLGSQPLQLHVGVWIVLGMAVTVFPRIQATPRSYPESPPALSRSRGMEQPW